MNLLVTGGYGFIASNFINNNFIHCDTLVNVDILNYCSNENNVFDAIKMNPKYAFYKRNICDKIVINC